MRYVLLIAGVYELLIGASELIWVSTSSPTLAGVAQLPSVSSLADTFIGGQTNANTIEGGIDVLVGALLIWWGLRIGG